MLRSHFRSVLPALAIALLAMLGVTVTALMAASHFYLQRAELRLMPVRSDVYMADNAALPAHGGARIVFFGDSRIEDWTPRPRSGGMELVWRGIGGETTAQMVYRFQQDVIALKPRAVVIQAGINDLVAGSALGIDDRVTAQTVENIQRMIRLARASSVDVYLLTILKPSTPPIWRLPVWSSDIYALVDSCNERIRSLAGDGVAILDVDRQLTGIEGRMPGRLSRDTLHLNDSGYALLNTTIEGALGVRASAVQ